MGRRKEFSADWDSFIRKTQGLARSQRSAMMDEVRLSSRLLLIVGVEAEIRNRNTRINNMQRLAAEMHRRETALPPNSWRTPQLCERINQVDDATDRPAPSHP